MLGQQQVGRSQYLIDLSPWDYYYYYYYCYYYEASYVARIEKDRHCSIILTDKSTETFNRPKRRWEENIRIDFKEIGINTKNRIDSGHDRDYWRAPVNCDIEAPAPQVTKLVNYELSYLEVCGRMVLI